MKTMLEKMVKKCGVELVGDVKEAIDTAPIDSGANVKKRVNAANIMIGTQFGRSKEERLMCAIVTQAVRDAFLPPSADSDRPGAFRFLEGDMSPAQMCGVEPVWIRKVLKQAGLRLK